MHSIRQHYSSWPLAPHLEGVPIAQYSLLHDRLWCHRIHVCSKNCVHDRWRESRDESSTLFVETNRNVLIRIDVPEDYGWHLVVRIIVLTTDHLDRTIVVAGAAVELHVRHDEKNLWHIFTSNVVAVANKKSDTALVDIRSSDEFTGKVIAPAGVQELAIRAGHIPGAVNVPWGQAVAEDGTFKSAEELKKIYGAVGIDGKKPIITYCRIGERSSHTWFALSKILGYDVRNYDGSWTEYGNSVGNPVINTAGTVWGGK